MAGNHKDILIVDDEVKWTENLAERLRLRDMSVHTVNRGEDAIRQVRLYDYDVVLLDLKMPGMGGEDVLKEIKELQPTCQVIVLTGNATYQSATQIGRLDAYAFHEKTLPFEELLSEIDLAKRDRVHLLTRHDKIADPFPGFWRQMIGVTNYRPLFILIGLLLFGLVLIMPTPESLDRLISTPKTGAINDPIGGYASFKEMPTGMAIKDYYAKKAALVGDKHEAFATEDAAFKVKIMIGLLVIAAFFWGTGAIPIGFTSILIAVVLYWFQILPPEEVAKSFLKDSVLFIFGVLAMSVGIAKTGLDRRIGVVLLGLSSNMRRFLFIFVPLFSVTASFISEHALVAFITPIMLVVYMASIKTAGLKSDKYLALTLLLIVTWAGNIGGPGSPSAGGRNAIMLGILKDYGVAPSYGEWVKYGLPFVPVMALVIGVYFYFFIARKVKVKGVNIAEIVKGESKRLGPMVRKEYMMAAVLGIVIIGWITLSGTFGMAGPVLLGLLLMSLLRLVRWKDITHINWEVVFLYAAATALGKGLAMTGAALYIAKGFLAILPESMSSGAGLAIAASAMTAMLTNLMSDGATVSAVGPITVPMAVLADTHPWMVGLATAFASSFAHILIIGTPNNAIVYALAENPETGERLITLGDFAKHGLAIFLLSLLVLWGWTIAIYWNWLGFPAM